LRPYAKQQVIIDSLNAEYLSLKNVKPLFVNDKIKSVWNVNVLPNLEICTIIDLANKSQYFCNSIFYGRSTDSICMKILPSEYIYSVIEYNSRVALFKKKEPYLASCVERINLNFNTDIFETRKNLEGAVLDYTILK
jgi:hypothetical protein